MIELQLDCARVCMPKQPSSKGMGCRLGALWKAQCCTLALDFSLSFSVHVAHPSRCIECFRQHTCEPAPQTPRFACCAWWQTRK
eukprot:scaffold7425_cov16-Tisochrysis_lutea.AAC.1